MPPSWSELRSVEDVERLKLLSFEKPCLIFKHSTRCNISDIARYRLQSEWDIATEKLQPFYLDLIRYREVSNYIADTFSVWHESPQILVVVKGDCVLDNSHLDISLEEIKEAVY